MSSDTTEMDAAIERRLDAAVERGLTAFGSKLEEMFERKFSALTSQLADVQLAQGELRRAVVDVAEQAKGATFRAEEAHDKIASMQTRVSRLHDMVCDLQLQAERRLYECNVVLSGIDEAENEDLKAIIVDVAKHATTQILPTDIVSANRLGKADSGAKPQDDVTPGSRPLTHRPRLVKVQFSNQTTARKLLANSRTLRESSQYGSVYVNEDLTPSERIRRRQMVPKYRELRRQGMQVSLRRAAIWLKGRQMTDDEVNLALRPSSEPAAMDVSPHGQTTSSSQ